MRMCRIISLHCLLAQLADGLVYEMRTFLRRSVLEPTASMS